MSAAANDIGPLRYICERAIDIRKIAEQLNINEDDARETILIHEKEITEEIYKTAVDLIAEICIREGVIAISEFDEDYMREIGASLT